MNCSFRFHFSLHVLPFKLQLIGKTISKNFSSLKFWHFYVWNSFKHLIAVQLGKKNLSTCSLLPYQQEGMFSYNFFNITGF